MVAQQQQQQSLFIKRIKLRVIDSFMIFSQVFSDSRHMKVFQFVICFFFSTAVISIRSFLVLNYRLTLFLYVQHEAPLRAQHGTYMSLKTGGEGLMAPLSSSLSSFGSLLLLNVKK